MSIFLAFIAKRLNKRRKRNFSGICFGKQLSRPKPTQAKAATSNERLMLATSAQLELGRRSPKEAKEAEGTHLRGDCKR